MRAAIKKRSAREDLGSVGELFDAAFAQRFHDLAAPEVILGKLDHDVTRVGGSAREDLHVTPAAVDTPDLAVLRAHIDLSPETLRRTLEVALGAPLEGPDGRGRMRMKEIPHGWKPVVDDTLRLNTAKNPHGPPALVFDPPPSLTPAVAAPSSGPPGIDERGVIVHEL